MTRISAKLPQRVPSTPPELRDAQYAEAGRLFAESEKQIFVALNSLIQSGAKITAGSAPHACTNAIASGSSAGMPPTASSV